MWHKLLSINAAINNSKMFWWLMGAINSTNFALHITSGRWWYSVGALALVMWSIYELCRIQNLNLENKNVK